MNRLHKILLQTLLSVLVAALNSSCSAEAKKSRALHRAEDYFKAGDYDKAKIKYTNVLRLDPKDANAFLKIGTMWFEEGVPTRAGPFIMRAKELAPARAEMRTKLAELYASVGALAEARKEATEALKLEPGNEDALLILSDVARSPEEMAQVEAELGKSRNTETLKYRLAAATLALRKNNLSMMEAELRRALVIDPNSSVAHLALARDLFGQNKKDQAAKEFQQAADTGQARAPAKLMYAQFKAQSGSMNEAVAYLTDVLKQAPDYIPGWVLLSKMTSSSDLGKAIDLLDNVFRRDNQNLEARLLESNYSVQKGDFKRAIDSLKQLESNYQKVPIVKFELARASLLSGDAAQALASVEQALALAPNYPDAIVLQAEANLRLGNNAAVVAAMEDFLKTNPNVDRANVVLADAYRAMGRFEDATAVLEKQAAAEPGKAEPFLMLGVLARQQHKTDEARQNFEKALALSQNKLAAANQLIEMDIEANDFASALRRIAPALEKYPDEPGLLLLQGKIYAAQKEWDKAEEALLKVVELNPAVPDAYNLLVNVYIGAQKLPQAAKQVEAYLAKNPANPGALMVLGLIYSELKEPEKARDADQKLLALKPDNAVAANNLAYIYADQLKQLDKAREWAARARNNDPKNPAIADTFGWILYRQNDYKQAASLIKEAAEKLPNEAEVQYHYGMASFMMGDRNAAQIAFEAAALSPADFPGKDEAKKRLALFKEGEAGGDASIDQLEALLKQQPNDPAALAKLADLYEKQGAAEKAADYYEQAIKANPNLPAPIIKLAELYAGPLAKKERALELAKKAREIAPHDANTTRTLGRLAFRAGNFSWSYSLLQDSSRQLPNDASVLKDFAWAAYSVSKISDARETMEKLVKSAADSPQANEAKVFLAFTSPEATNGDALSMQREIDYKLQEDPGYVPALMLRAREELARGEKVVAAQTYQQVLKIFPDFAPAQKYLAGLYLDEPNQSQKAYDLAANARKVLTQDPELALILARASFLKKDYARAAQLFQEVNRQKPIDAVGLFYLGMSLRETKNVPQARQALEAALSNGLEEPLASAAKKALEASKTK